MRKVAVNLLVDLIAAVALTALVATGYLLWFVLPPGTNRTHELLGLLRHEWGSIHFWLAVGLLTTLAVHLSLHWRWLSMGLCKRLGIGDMVEDRPKLAGAILMVVAVVPLLLVAVVAHAGVRPLAEPLHGATARTLLGSPGDPQERAGTAGTAPRGGEFGPANVAVAILIERQVAELLATRCADCHGAGAPRDGIRMDTIASLLLEQHGTRWVVPGRSGGSPIFRVLHAHEDPGSSDGEHGHTQGSRRMRYHALPATDLDRLQEWVDSLAP